MEKRIFTFKKDGVDFVFEMFLNEYGMLEALYKAPGKYENENAENPSGYFSASINIMDEKRKMIRCQLKLNNKTYNGVQPPPNVFEEMLKYRDELLTKREAEKEKARQVEYDKLGFKKVEVIKKYSEAFDEGRTYITKVKITEKGTGKSLQFACRDIFDFGKVINPCYAVADGSVGGLPVKDSWQVEGRLIKMTDFEKKCVDFLYSYPPAWTRRNYWRGAPKKDVDRSR